MPSSSDRRADGAAWEDLARATLERHGLRMLATNAHCRFGELDLVMADGATVVFVEVRYRRGGGFGGGLASVDARKRRRIALAAQAFLAARPPLARRPCRFDVVAVSGSADAPRIDWVRNAFSLDDL
ncbi:YraN family protein [Rehaibacterium terrae]|jgi:putative endonuclease|uniref:UPF0102 protein HNQ58_000412 n=1 Tax=Rehaibacterium terrae TaxID=1341696 RepID=A0A7W7V7C7_9GAMM|nr:YraN family protein [Rehaibacterium terrae]MBB5014538.1 putative endonuclease [Rehaibacterium terrae]